MFPLAEVFPDEQIVSAPRRQLTWTHFKNLICLDDPLKRDFYTVQQDVVSNVDSLTSSSHATR